MFRFRSNGMVIRRLLSWTFDRLTVPLTFRPGPRIESHRAARADASVLVSLGPASRPDERLSLHTAEATGSKPVTPTSHQHRSDPHTIGRRRPPEPRQAANRRRAHSGRPARERACPRERGCSGSASCWPARAASPPGPRSPAPRQTPARSHSSGEGHGTSAAPPSPNDQGGPAGGRLRRPSSAALLPKTRALQHAGTPSVPE
jgi:hypothetical protein